MSDFDGRRSPLLSLRKNPFVFPFLLLISSAFSLAAKTRRSLYQQGVFWSGKLGCRVISIGNLTTGGTGKSAAVLSLAKHLAGASKSVAILLRGYKRLDRKKDIVVVSDGKGNIASLEDSGDEALMMAEAVPDVPIVVGPDRVKTGLHACKRFSPDVIILDDGFQHLGIKRDRDVVLVDVSDPFGGGFCLPAGSLREGPKALRAADRVILTKADTVIPEQKEAIIKQINKYHPGVIIAQARHAPARLVSLFDRSVSHASDFLAGKKVLAVAGLASPEGFFRSLEDCGAGKVHKYVFDDHHQYDGKDARDICEKFKGQNADMIVTTHKDAVRIRKHLPLFPENTFFLEVEFSFMGRNTWEDII